MANHGHSIFSVHSRVIMSGLIKGTVDFDAQSLREALGAIPPLARYCNLSVCRQIMQKDIKNGIHDLAILG